MKNMRIYKKTQVINPRTLQYLIEAIEKENIGKRWDEIINK